MDYPYLVDAEPQPALYLLLCCQDYLRVYSTGEWVGGWCECGSTGG